MGRPLTGKADRLRSGYGSLLMQVPSDGACPQRKCIRKENHAGECWPKGN